MNFIFDIGNVLIDFKPELFLKDLLHNTSNENKINEIIFKSNEWVKLDEGIITPKEACLNFCLREPSYESLIVKTMNHLPDMLTPIPETIALLPKIKAAGHKIYFLSNYHKELGIYVKEKYSFFSLFSGGVFSCDVHMLKPSPEIYKYFLDKYKLDPCDCLFFDDTEKNINAAEKMGIKSILFTDAQNVICFI